MDEIVYFNQLTEENFKGIAVLMLRELAGSLAEKGITFYLGRQSLLDYLVKKSYSLTYGARNLRRQIQKDLEDPIATRIIESYLNPVRTLHASSDGETVQITGE